MRRQADALIDVYYYSLNAAAKKGINLSAIFKIVHAANMAKRDPATGKFLKRDDGKIIKPAGWKVTSASVKHRITDTRGLIMSPYMGFGVSTRASQTVS